MMENSTASPLDNYVAVSNWFLTMQGQSCIDASYADQVTSLTNLTDFSGGRSWTYMTCAQVGYFQSTDSPSQPFGHLVPLQYYTQLCIDAFGLNMTTLPRIGETNRVYGADNVVGSTRIMFTNCAWDEWSSLSITSSQSPSLPAIVVRDGAHCCMMDTEHPGFVLNPEIKRGQHEISKQIGLWLKAGPQ